MSDAYATTEQLQAWARSTMTARDPDVIIGEASDPYMLRWWLVPRNEGCNVYLHRILRSDDDRALHDHPWANTSFLLEGEYDEVLPIRQDGRSLFIGDYQPHHCHTIRRKAGDIVTRQATDAHRLILPEGGAPVISLFMTGPKVRDWGFWSETGWKHWKEFTCPCATPPSWNCTCGLNQYG